MASKTCLQAPPPFLLPRLPLSSLCSRIFFFTHADFFSFFPQCRAWSQANKRISQRPQTLENTLNLLAELKPLFLESFQGSQTQFQSNRLVMLRMDMYVPANLYQAKWPDKPRIIWRYKIKMLLLAHEYTCTLFVCIWSRHLKLYLRKWTLIQMFLRNIHFITWIALVSSIQSLARIRV